MRIVAVCVNACNSLPCLCFGVTVCVHCDSPVLSSCLPNGLFWLPAAFLVFSSQWQPMWSSVSSLIVFWPTL